jgi:hypothetical protein
VCEDYRLDVSRVDWQLAPVPFAPFLRTLEHSAVD